MAKKRIKQSSTPPADEKGSSTSDSEFARFERLTKRLLSVHKREIDKQKRRKAG